MDADNAADGATHVASGVQIEENKIQLIRVYGPSAIENARSLALTAIYTPSQTTLYNEQDIARSILYLHPQISVLTAEHSTTVLQHISQTATFKSLVLAIRYKKDSWNTVRPLLNDQQQPMIKADGSPHVLYDYDHTILNLSGKIAAEAKKAIYNDFSLENIRWSLQKGVSHKAQNVQTNKSVKQLQSGGYHYRLQDGGPHYGLSAEILSLDQDAVLTFKITNSYIRHLSIFINFQSNDGKTLVEIPEHEWISYLRDIAKDKYIELLDIALADPLVNAIIKAILGGQYHRFIGTVGAETTFMGVPVASNSQEFSFQLPIKEHDIGKIKILCGSLGLASGFKDDPAVAVIGAVMTIFIDLIVPAVSIAMGVGSESNTLYESFVNPKFIVPITYALYQVVSDIATNSPNLANDLQDFIISKSEKILTLLLSSIEVTAELAAIFGAEALEESIPYVGLALKILSIEAAGEQLLQTVCEVLASPDVTEFTVAVTLDADITLRPDMTDFPDAPPQFAETAHSYTLTAQYSDVLTHSFSGEITDPKVESLIIPLQDIPAGGKVTFIVALYSEEGHLVGKGSTGEINNTLAEGQDILTATINVKELLYPLNEHTRYQHRHILEYQHDHYQWQQTDTPPTATAKNLGAGSEGHQLEQLAGITLNANQGIVAQAWQASDMNIPSIDGGQTQVALFGFQNMSYGANPEAGYMFTPKGFSAPPKLAYIRAVGATDNQTAHFYVDPTGDADSGYHLRKLNSITDAAIPASSPQRLFDLDRSSSHGRFRTRPTSVAIHSQGYAVAVTAGNPTLQILKMDPKPVPDSERLWPAVMCGPGDRKGLLDDPRLVAITPDQTVLVLEKGGHRIQAFNFTGVPVDAFTNTENPCWIPLQNPQGVTYLSMDVEIQGHIYVHYHEGNGYDIDQFHLDIYSPGGERLVSQQGINAGSLCVDLWRNLYTQNYQALTGPGQRSEPSVSEYAPHTPVTQDATQELAPSESGNWQSLGNWRLKFSDLGTLTAYGHEFAPTMYAGGFTVVGVGHPKNSKIFGVVNNSWDKWNLYADLDRRILAIRSDPIFHGANWYLNSHLIDQGKASYLWVSRSKYQSNTLTEEQQFRLHNLGHGNVAFEALHGPLAGQFLSAEQGGWYPTNGGYGRATVNFRKVSSPANGQKFLVEGSQLPILKLTNSARDCNLSKENLSGLNLTGADFTNATLHDTRFAGVITIKDAQFSSAQLQGAMLDGVDLGTAAGFEQANFSGTDLRQVAGANNAHMNHAKFQHANLSGVSMAGAQLHYADFSGAILDNVDFSGADLTMTNFDGASMKGANLQGAILQGTCFNHVNLSDTLFDSKPDFARRTENRNSFCQGVVPWAVISDNWSYLNLTDATITGIPDTIELLQAQHAWLPNELDLSGKQLAAANFESARLTRLQAHNANFYGANFRNASLNGAKLNNANLSMADLTGAFLQDGNASSHLQAGKHEAAQLNGAIMINTCLDYAHCDYVNFSDSYFLTYAGYSSARQASAIGAICTNAKFNNAKLIETRFDNAQLSEAEFDSAICVAASFKQAQLSPPLTAITGAAILEKADIRGADFSEANMDGVNMQGATVSVEPGSFSDVYTFENSEPIFISLDFGLTQLGNTTSGTTCPDGSSGPCHLTSDYLTR
ncbi:pentapeptide repeat-containing protein [Oceanobacter mangrovi]|uniref:pentapeptide repeat-containing protein n=1 Tax=Oceanobacter mangrovi TaxID=2862510 RepID=UPI001C8DEE33